MKVFSGIHRASTQVQHFQQDGLAVVHLSSISSQATLPRSGAPATPRKSLMRHSWLCALVGTSSKGSLHLTRGAALHSDWCPNMHNPRN